MENKFKILGVVFGILVFVSVAFWVSRLKQKQVQSPLPLGEEESCVKTETGEEMTLLEAKQIALRSECIEEGSLTGEYFCNQDTGTWWLDLDIEKPGCAPACVINVSTGEAEINWRCTGLIPPVEKTFCEEPRPQFCTMECIVNPPYICGSDGKSYCSECQACADPDIEWYMIQDEPCEAE